MTLVQALLAAAEEMPSLVKDDMNTHGGYRFVSIDDYYRVAAKVALKHGLTWKVRETGAELVDTGKSMAYQLKYSVDLIYVGTVKGHDDVDYDVTHVDKDFFTCSILHPLIGAQTSGSAMSYAVKLFLRTTFHIVTGEADADTTDNSVFDMDKPHGFPEVAKKSLTKVDTSFPAVMQGAPGPVSGSHAFDTVAEADQAATIINMANVGFALCKTKELLLDFWTKNEGTFKQLKGLDTKAYNDIRATFRKMNEELA